MPKKYQSYRVKTRFADRQKLRFFQNFCFIRKVSTKSCRMSPIGLLYDQNSRFSQFRNFFKNQIYYKGGGVFIKQEMIHVITTLVSFYFWEPFRYLIRTLCYVILVLRGPHVDFHAPFLVGDL